MRQACILVENMYEDMEFWYPYYRLQEAGFEVICAAPEAGVVYTSKHGYPAESQVSAGSVDAETVDVLVVPGGFAPDKLRRYPEVLDLVKNAYEHGAVVASICHGPWVLISAGITKGTRMTSVSAIRDDLVNSGADWVDEPVVVDKRIVTSRTPVDLPAFMQAVLAEAE